MMKAINLKVFATTKTKKTRVVIQTKFANTTLSKLLEPEGNMNMGKQAVPLLIVPKSIRLS
jgi:hypothetical protein